MGASPMRSAAQPHPQVSSLTRLRMGEAPMPRFMTREKRNLRDGLAFLAPNILGFLAFTAFPLFFSLVLAFSNWDLKLHNRFKPEGHLRFIGFENFATLLRDTDFWKFLGNTLFMMMGLPVAIAASLGCALLLDNNLRG